MDQVAVARMAKAQDRPLPCGQLVAPTCRPAAGKPKDRESDPPLIS